MGYSRYIGRVGALAVALGVGTAVAASAGVASADDRDTQSADNKTDSSATGNDSTGSTGKASTATGDNAETDDDNNEDADEDDGQSESREPDEPGEGAPVGAEGGDAQLEDEDQGKEEVAQIPNEDATGGDPAVSVGDQRAQGPTNRRKDKPAEIASSAVATPAGKPEQAAASTAEVTVAPSRERTLVSEQPPAAAGTPVITHAFDDGVLANPPAEQPAGEPPTGAVASLVSGLLNPFGENAPEAPMDSPAEWVLLAAARREVGQDTNNISTFATTTEVTNSLVTTAVDPNLGTVIIDPLTGAVSGTVVAADPTGQNRKPSYAVTTPPGSGTFTINKTTGAFTYTPTAAQRVLAGFSAIPDDTVAVVVTVTYGTTKIAKTLSVPVDPVSITDIGDVATGDGAYGLAVTNDRAYVSNTDAGTVTVIDTVTGQWLADIDVDDEPMGIALTPDGKKLYVTSATTRTVSVIDTATRQVTAQIQLGQRSPQLMAISPDGKTLYVTTTVYDDDGLVVSSEITKISTATNKIAGAVKNVGLVPYGITVSPDGKNIYVIAEVESEGDYQTGVFVFSATGSTAKQIVGVGDRPEAVAVSRDNKLVYIGDYNTGTISVVNAATNAVVTSFTTSPESIDEIVVHPSGTMLMVLNFQTNAIDIYNIAAGYTQMGSVPTNATTEINFPEAKFSPDGQQLYFTSDGVLQAVSLVPVNTQPEVGTPTPGVVTPATGAVTGDFGVTDPDDDTLKYTVVSGPARGKLVVNPNGTYTYTPTPAARHVAAADDAGDLAFDSFTVTVTDGRRGVVTQTVTVNIEPANKVPTIKQTVGKPVAATGVVSGSVTATDADRDAVTYTKTSDPQWGTVAVDAKGKFVYTPTPDARHAAATPTGAKTDSFTITVDDGHGSTQAVAVSVAIAAKNTAPTASGSIERPDNSSGVVTGSITPTDGDGDVLTYSTSATTKGTLVVNADGTFTYTPTPQARAAVRTGGTAAKTETFTITVSDGHGGTSTVTMTAQIVAAGNRAPTGVAEVPNPPSTSSGAVTGKITGSDLDGDKVTYSVPATTAKGTVKVTAAGVYTYTPTAAARHAAAGAPAGSALTKDTFTVTVQDGVGGWGSVTVEVDILGANAKPTGRATAKAPNANGDVIVTVTGTDRDKDTLTFAAPTTTAKGTVVHNGNGSFTYTPTPEARQAAGANGAPAASKTDTFTVTIDDGHGGVTPVTVKVSIAPTNINAAPTGGSYTPTGQPNSTTGVVTGKVSASDPNGDPLTYSGSGTTDKGTYNVTSNGTLTYTPTPAARHAASADGATTTVTQDTVSISVSDGRGGTHQFAVTVDIDPKNTAPTGSFTASDPNASAVVTGTVTSGDTDGDALTMSAPGTSAKGGTVTFNATTGVYTYKPTDAAREAAAAPNAPAAAKTDTFAVTITDGHGGTTTVTVQVSVAPAVTSVNPAPINGSPLGNAIVGSTGRIFQPVVTVSANGTVSTVVRVYQPSGAVIATTAAFTGTPAPPITRTDGGITLITYDEAAKTATVRIISASGNVTATTVTAEVGFAVVGENGRDYLLVPYFDAAQNRGRARLLSLTAGPATAYVIDMDPSFGPDGSAAALQVSGTAQNPSARIVAIDADGNARTLTIPSSHVGGATGNVTAGPNGTAYLATVVQTPSGEATEVLVFGSSGGFTTRRIDGFTPTQDVIVAPNGTAYVLTERFGTQEHRVYVITNGVVGTPSFTSFFGPTALGAAADGTLYVLNPDSDADVNRLLIVGPNASMKTVEIGEFDFSVPHVIGTDNNIYLNLRVNGQDALVVVAPSGLQRALPFYVDVEPSFSGEEKLVFADDGTAYALVQTANGYVVHASTDGFFTSGSSDPINASTGHLQVGPDGTAYLVSNNSEALVTRIDRYGNITGTVVDYGGTVVGPIAFGNNGTAYVTVQKGFGATATTTVWAITAASVTVVKTVAGTAAVAALGSQAQSPAVSISDSGKVILTSVTESAQGGNPTTQVSLSDEVSVPPLRSSVTQQRPVAATGVVTGSVTQAPPDSDPTSTMQYSGSTTGPLGTVVVNPDGTYTFTPSAAARTYVQAQKTAGYVDFFVKAADSQGGVSYIPVSAPILPANYPTQEVVFPPVSTHDLIALPGYIDPSDWHQVGTFDVTTLAAFLKNGRDVIGDPCVNYDCGSGDRGWDYQIQNRKLVKAPPLQTDPETGMPVSPDVYVLALLNPPGSQSGDRIVLGWRKMRVGEDITVKQDYNQTDRFTVTYEAMAFMPGTFPEDQFHTRIPGVVGGYIFNNEIPESADTALQIDEDNMREEFNRKEARRRAASSLGEGAALTLWGLENLNPVGVAGKPATRGARAVKTVAPVLVDGVVVTLDVMSKDEAVQQNGSSETPMLYHEGANLGRTQIGIPPV